MKKLLIALALSAIPTAAVAGVYSKYQLPWAPGTCIYFTGYTYKVGPC